MRRLTAFIMICVMFAMTACGSKQVTVDPECTTKIHFLCISKDNSAMDCILIESGGRFGMVDCGYWDQREQITNSMTALGVTPDNLDFIIGTHAHADHIGAMNFLVQNYNVERIYLMPFSAECLTEPEEWTDESWDNVMKTADEMGLPVVDSFEEGASETPWLPESDESGAAESGESTEISAKTVNAAAKSTTVEAKSVKAADDSIAGNAVKTSSKTDSTASKADSTASKADSTASKADSTASKADSTASKADSTASKADSTASKADSTASKADSTASKTDSTASKTDSTASKVDSTATKAESTANDADSAAATTYVKGRGKAGNHYTASPHFTFGDAEIDILNYSQEYRTEKVVNANDTSLVVKVTAGGHTALLTGDVSNAEGRGEDPGYDETALADLVGHVDLLKLSHHGYGWYNTNIPEDLKKFDADHIVQTGATSMLFTDDPDSYNEVIREIKKGAVYVATFWYDRRIIGGDGLHAITYNMSDLTSNVPGDVSILAVNRDGESIMFKGGKTSEYTYDEKTYLSNGSRNDFGTIEVDGVWYEIDNNSRIIGVLD